MSNAIINGAQAGFNMMDRHYARLDNKNRLARLDEQNESRYRDSQARLEQADQRNDERYKDTLDYRKQTAKNTADYRKQTAEATKEYRDRQQKKQESDALWAQDQKMIGVGWDYFRANGQIAPEHEEMFQRNKGYSPRTLQNPETRNTIKALTAKLGEVINSGKMSQVNEPETVALFDQVFSDKFSASVGEYDDVAKSKISAVNFAGFVPTDSKDGSVSLALKVTYENGTQTIKPMTQGRSTDKDDPVMQMKPDELIGAIQAKMMMADMIERPEYWDKMSGSVAENLTKRRRTTATNQEDKTQAAYRKELTAINKDMTNAIAKIQGDSNFMDEESRSNAIARVERLFKQRKDGLNKAYGIESEPELAQDKPQSSNRSSRELSDEELMAKLNKALDEKPVGITKTTPKESKEAPPEPEPVFTDQKDWWLKPEMPTEARKKMTSDLWQKRSEYLEKERNQTIASENEKQSSGRKNALEEVNSVFPNLSRPEQLKWLSEKGGYLTTEERKQFGAR